MKHTYLYESLNWKAEGTYYDDMGISYDLYGEVQIVRNPEQWSLDGFLKVSFSSPVQLTNSYSIAETDNETTLRWKSTNPVLGILKGTFEMIGDSIISCYTSADGVYSGTETLIQKNRKTYYNIGVSFQNGNKMSSWTASLKAEDGK